MVIREIEPTFIDSSISLGNRLRPVFMLVCSTIVPLLYFNELYCGPDGIRTHITLFKRQVHKTILPRDQMYGICNITD